MSGEQEIIDTITRLFVGTDKRDWTAVQQCFAPSVLFDMTSMAGGQPSTLTPRQITDGWDEGLKAMQAIHHQAGNYLVRVSGEQADAFCYGIAYHYRKVPSGRNTRVFVGSYDFHLVRSAGGWAIDRFRFNLKFIDGNATLDQE